MASSLGRKDGFPFMQLPVGVSEGKTTMQDLWNRYIEPNVEYLVDNLGIGPNLRFRFSATKLLTESESEALELQESPEDKANYFLFELLQFKKADAFYVLCAVLRDAGRAEIVERMLRCQAKETSATRRSSWGPPTLPKPVCHRKVSNPVQTKQEVPVLQQNSSEGKVRCGVFRH